MFHKNNLQIKKQNTIIAHKSEHQYYITERYTYHLTIIFS